MIKILHTADWHLRNTQFARLSRGGDFFTAALEVVNVAIKEKVKAIVNCGDVIDSVRPSPNVIDQLKLIDKKLRDANIPMYLTSGNHDYTKPHWAEIVVPVGADKTCGIVLLEDELITVPNTNITVYGTPYKPMCKLVEEFDSMPKACVGMFHLALVDVIHFKSDNSIGIEDLPLNKFNFIALGDIHTRFYKETLNGTLVGYPGSTELCEAAESPNKSVTLIEFKEDGSVAKCKEIPINTRKVLRFELHSEADVDKAMLEVDKEKDSYPIILLYYYNSDIKPMLNRFKTVVDINKAIIRDYPKIKTITNTVVSDLGGVETVREFAESIYSKENDDAFSLLLACLEDPENTGSLVDDYVRTKTDYTSQPISV